MSDEIPFYSPNRGPAPTRQPKPGEEVWRLQHGSRIQSCELRNDSKVGAGWDVMVREDGGDGPPRRALVPAVARPTPLAASGDLVLGEWA